MPGTPQWYQEHELRHPEVKRNKASYPVMTMQWGIDEVNEYLAKKYGEIKPYKNTSESYRLYGKGRGQY